MMSIDAIQDEIVEEFSLFEDPMDKYEYIIEIGKGLPELNDQYRTDDNLVKGCQSKVWLHAHELDDKIIYEADSNTVITKGIIGLLTRVLSGQSTDDILATDLNFIDRIDLKSHLSSQRSNGLNAMIKQMKLYALAFKTKSETTHK